MAITVRRGDSIVFEWYSQGNYCADCQIDLWRAIYETLPVPDLGDAAFMNNDIAKHIELALIGGKSRFGYEVVE